MSEGNLPLVSIITPVYNGAKYLPALIASVCDQDYPKIEHIIIDDGSTDSGATIAVLKSYPHLRWWSRENRGQYTTMNEGLRAANGDWVCFISVDDLIATGTIRRVVESFITHPDCDVVYGSYLWINEDGSPRSVDNSYQRFSLRYYPYLAHLAHSSIYVRKQTLMTKSLFFEEKDFLHVSDYDWITRLARSDIKSMRLNIALSKIRVHPEQISSKYGWLMAAERKKVVERNHINRLALKLFGWLSFSLFLLFKVKSVFKNPID